MKARWRHLSICFFAGILLFLFLFHCRIQEQLTSTSGAASEAVVISVLRQQGLTPVQVNFGLTNISSARLCFEPRLYEIFDASGQRERFVAVQQRGTVFLDAGSSGVLAFEEPPDSRYWRLSFDITAHPRSNADEKGRVPPRIHSKNGAEIWGFVATSPMIHNGKAVSNAVKITMRQRFLLYNVFE